MVVVLLAETNGQLVGVLGGGAQTRARIGPRARAQISSGEKTSMSPVWR